VTAGRWAGAKPVGGEEFSVDSGSDVPTGGSTSVQDSVVDRYYAAFNARDFDAWVETLEEDVEVLIDAGVLRGRLVARSYLSGILQAYPGVTVADRRVVAQSPDAVVSEFHLLNPTAARVPDTSGSDGPGVPWRLDGVTCEVLRLRGDRISSLHSYYSPTPTDRTPVAEVPSRAEAARIAHRQAALGRVATQVAGGGSEQDLVTVINQVIAEFAGVDVSLLMRFETDDTAIVLAMSDGVDDLAAIGQRLQVPDDIRAVRDSGLALRFGVNGWPLGGPLDRPARGKELRWFVGVPITLHGRVWGVSLLGSTQNEPFADDIEEGIVAFTQLASTALANAQANDELRERAREQAELLETAEIAAGGAEPPEVFAAIVRSASALLDGLPTMLQRFVDHESADLLAVYGIEVNVPRAGKRVTVGPDGVTAEVQRTGQPARIDDYRKPPGNPLAAQVGIRASVGVPVQVGGQSWGVLLASSSQTALPPAAERRLSLIADTGAAAIAGAAARGELLALAQEQAALRRVAELVARGVSQGAIFDALTAEAAGLIDEPTTLVRLDEPQNYTVLATCGGLTPVGARVNTEAGSLVAEILRTRQSARIDGSERTGRIDGNSRDHDGGFSEVGVPIIVGARLWGMLSATSSDHRLAGTIEHRLRQFVGIMAVAVVNGEARGQLQDLADEQTALRRVAELVARGATLDEVFTAAATEASTLLGKFAAALMRYDEGDTAVVVAMCNSPVPLGLKVPSDDSNALGTVRRTGRPARTDTFAGTSLASIATALGVGAGVAVPVTVEGRVWGALTASTSDLPFPAASEERLTPLAELVAAAIGNAQNKAKLTASRARVVVTADETRRRLQRDVHDGAQQRLVHTIIALKLARDVLAAEHPAAGLLQEGLSHAERANSELRDIVRGILPASLTHGGLRSGLETLVADLALPVDLTVVAPRLPAHIETTAYFVVAEAMTNVVKHAHAHRATVDVRVDDDTLVLDIRDDGVGGADPTGGSGITGLFDRVEASDGILTVTSYPGAGTAIHAAIPVREQPTANHPGDVSVSL
jgi:signal transduction histidine kinase